MDEIFRQSKGVFVFTDKTLTQRERPQAFMDAERRRIETMSDTEGSRIQATPGLLLV
jgi:hypothetical protein